jgi:hypothetical protein
MKALTTLIILATCLTFSSAAPAQDAHRAQPATPHATEPSATSADDDAHASGAVRQPVLPRHAAWAGVMVIVILLGFFLPAAVIGPIARALAPEDEPVTTSHDEHGGSHDHGHHDTAHAHHH